jgi:flavorubredoxin
MDDFKTDKSVDELSDDRSQAHKLLILFSSWGRIPALAQEMAKAIERLGVSVQLLQAEVQETSPISCGKYDAVIIGTPVQGLFGGKIAPDIIAAIKRCTRLEGKTSVVFIQPSLFGNIKAVQKAMSLLEQQGSIVKDYVIIGGSRDIINFVSRLKGIL